MRSIQGVQLFLGDIFSDVEARLANAIHFSSYGGWPNIRVKHKEIFGFATSQMNVRAPLVNRPVMQVIFDLAPIQAAPARPKTTEWLDALIEKFGVPSDVYTAESSSSGSVIFSGSWISKDIRMVLSIYGGVRSGDSGYAAGGLFFDLTDEVAIAAPFVAEMKKAEQILWSGIKEPLSLEIFELQWPCRPFEVQRRTTGENVDNNLYHISQLALYKNGLYETPAMIRHRLNDRTIALWSTHQHYFVSTLYETALVRLDDNCLSNVLPARGPGETGLQINDLNINDAPNSQAIKHLTDRITSISGNKVRVQEYYDA